jgi:hypothetical protein
MLSLMLDSTFKNLCLMLPFIGLEQGKVIVEKHDRKTLYSMLSKCYHHLHTSCKNVIVLMKIVVWIKKFK